MPPNYFTTILLVNTFEGEVVKKLALINAEQYFKRKDLKSIPWFALPNNLLEHPDFFDITGDELKAFIWILSVAAKTKKMQFDLDIRHGAYMIRLNEKHFHSCIKKLNGKRIQVIDFIDDVTNPLRTRDESVTNPYRFVPNTTEHNEHNEQNTSEPPSGVHEQILNEFNFPFLTKINDQVKRGWIETYKDLDFIIQEINKAVTWIYANPNKAPKSNFAKFFSNWLARNWEDHRKSLRGMSGVSKKNSTMGVIGV